jgi:hypothetical protein
LCVVCARARVCVSAPAPGLVVLCVRGGTRVARGGDRRARCNATRNTLQRNAQHVATHRTARCIVWRSLLQARGGDRRAPQLIGVAASRARQAGEQRVRRHHGGGQLLLLLCACAHAQSPRCRLDCHRIGLERASLHENLAKLAARKEQVRAVQSGTCGRAVQYSYKNSVLSRVLVFSCAVRCLSHAGPLPTEAERPVARAMRWGGLLGRVGAAGGRARVHCQARRDRGGRPRLHQRCHAHQDSARASRCW